MIVGRTVGESVEDAAAVPDAAAHGPSWPWCSPDTTPPPRSSSGAYRVSLPRPSPRELSGGAASLKGERLPLAPLWAAVKIRGRCPPSWRWGTPTGRAWSRHGARGHHHRSEGARGARARIRAGRELACVGVQQPQARRSEGGIASRSNRTADESTLLQSDRKE